MNNTIDYHQGSLCNIKSKKNALNMFVVLYPDIDEVIREKTVNNNWLPSSMTDPSGISELCLKQKPFIRLPTDQFVLLEQRIDINGTRYFKCLYTDIFGWLIENTKSFEIIERGG